MHFPKFHEFVWFLTPILCFIMQIENEYGPESKAYGAAGHNYLDWAAKMAVGLNTGVPWVMCKEDDAPDPMVSYLLVFSFHLPNLPNWLMHLFNSKI